MGEVERVLIELLVLAILGIFGVRKTRGIVILTKEALDGFGKQIEGLAEAQRTNAEELMGLKKSHAEQLSNLRHEIYSLPCTKEKELEHGRS